MMPTAELSSNTLFENTLSRSDRYLSQTVVRESVSVFIMAISDESVICRDLLALNVYLAMCYHKLDYYDVSQVSIVILLQ